MVQVKHSLPGSSTTRNLHHPAHPQIAPGAQKYLPRDNNKRLYDEVRKMYLQHANRANVQFKDCCTLHCSVFSSLNTADIRRIV